MINGSEDHKMQFQGQPMGNSDGIIIQTEIFCHTLSGTISVRFFLAKKGLKKNRTLIVSELIIFVYFCQYASERPNIVS